MQQQAITSEELEATFNDLFPDMSDEDIGECFDNWDL